MPDSDATLYLALTELGHPDRLFILRTCAINPASPKQIAAIGESTLGSIAYHVRAMHDGGLLELARERRVRGAIQHFYRLSARGRKLHLELGGEAAPRAAA